MTSLKLYLLGPPRVDLDEVSIEVKPRKALALLIYLACTAERQSRDTLATLLWPDSSQRGARAALRRRLFELNQMLPDNLLISDRDQVRLKDNPGIWLDVDQFQRRLSDCQSHGHTPDAVCPDCLDPLTEAIALYQADFLSGFTLPDCPEYDDWQFFQSENLRQALSSALGRLAELLGDQGNFEAALPHARRRLALDPLHEPAHRQLMRLYAQAGQQADALRQYELCRQTLEDELGVPPESETGALYNDIRAGNLPITAANAPIPTPPRPPSPPRHNLPTQTTSFIGREDELAEIKRLLLDEPDCRLLNLVGPGGIGKTRLAIATATQVLGEFPHGAYFVSLAPVGEVEDIVPAIAAALKLTFYGQAEPKTQLLDHLQAKKLLLLVDNFEHLLNGVYLLSEILRHAPDVTLLVTSRERLNLQEEWGYDVQGLAFPATLTADQTADTQLLGSYSGLTLFLQRARRAAASFAPSAEEMADIVRICHLVDGMPLGLELAAPWVRSLTCQEIAAEIEQNLDFLTTSMRNVPPRHRSLRAVFDQTWGRLPQAGQSVLSRLSVFRGGCTREAAERVTKATLPLLSSLVDKALLRRTNTGRYEIHELIRQFAETQLQTNPREVEQTQQRHRDYFVDFLEQRTAGVKGGRQKETLAEIKADMDNVRLVWRRAGATRDANAFERAAECLFVFYLYRSGHYEGQAAFQQAARTFIKNADTLGDDSLADNLVILDQRENLTSFLLAGQGYFLGRTLDGAAGQRLLERALALYRRSGNDDPSIEGFILLWLGWIVFLQGKDLEVLDYVEPTLAILTQTGDRWAEVWCLELWANTISKMQPLEGEELYKRGLAVCRASGDHSNLSYLNQNRSGVNMDLGRYAQAQQCVDEAISAAKMVDNVLALAYALLRRGEMEIVRGEYRQAIQTLQQAAANFDEIKTQHNVNWANIILAKAYHLHGDHEQAEQTFQRTLEEAAVRNQKEHIARCRFGLGCLAYDRRDWLRAETHQRTALALFQQLGHKTLEAELLCSLAQSMIGSSEHRLDEAKQCLGQALEIATKHQLIPIALDVCVSMAQMLILTEDMAQAVELLSLVEHHQSSTFETKEKARQLLAEFADELSSPSTQAAQARGKTLDWEQVAQRLIDDLLAAENRPRLQQPRHNLPTQTTSFIGREDELAEVQRLLLEESACRLLTLIGPGGTGKTRLALAMANQLLDAFPDGVYIVSMAPISEVDDVVPAIAEALRFTFYGNTDPKEQLLNYLSRKQMLLLIDNFEHLLDGAALLSEILSHAPNLTLLATSRERLNLQEEWLYEVAGLAFPKMNENAPSGLSTYSAVALFSQRARQTSANFTPSDDELAEIGRICQLVEGMPLGIELAAPWIRTLSCAEIAAEIERSLDFLATPLRNVPERHRSLRVVFEQTWERLSEEEQSVLSQLAVFRGGCTREAAEQVTGATLPVLSALVHKALLRRTNTGRFELHELVRQFAESQLQAVSQAVDQAQQRHREFFIRFLETRTAGVKGRRQVETLAEIEADIDNVRLSWRGATAKREAAAIERSAECLYTYYLYTNGFDEGQSEFRRAIAALTNSPDAKTDDSWLQVLVVPVQDENLVGFLLAGLGYFVAHRRDLQKGQILLKQALALLRRKDPVDRRKEAFALLWLGWTHYFQGLLTEGKRYARECLTLVADSADLSREGWALLLLGNCLRDGRPAEAVDVFQTGMTQCRESGDQILLGYFSHNMGRAVGDLGRYDQAQQHIDYVVTLSEKLANIHNLGFALFYRGGLEITQGKYRQAVHTLQQALTYFNEVGTAHASRVQIYLGLAYHLQG